MRVRPFSALRAESLLKAARAVSSKGLTWGSSGNLSIRVGEEHMLISASGHALGDLNEHLLAYCTLDGTSINSVQASLETPLHSAIYRARPEVDAVLHASPFYATLAAASTLAIDPRLTVDSAYYIRSVRRVAFYPPGSAELAAAIGEACQHSDVLLLDNHGAVTVGRSPSVAVTRIEALENLCRMTVYGALGVPLKPLEQTDVKEFLRSLEINGHA